MKIPIRHKEDNWTGYLEIDEDIRTKAWASHRQELEVSVTLYQDAYKPNGEYVEDPRIVSLNELETNV